MRDIVTKTKELYKRWWFLTPLTGLFFLFALWKCIKTTLKMLRGKKINWRAA
jgi:hypothetical protein